MNKITLNELDRELLQRVAIPDMALSALPPAKLMQSNSYELLDRPESPDNVYVEGARAGGYVLPTSEGRVFAPVPPGLIFGVIGFTQEWALYEPSTDGGQDERVDVQPKLPATARWRFDPAVGKKVHKTDSGLLVREEIGIIMLPEATGQICRYVTQKTAVKIGRAFYNRAQRLRVDDVCGCVLGRFRATSFLKSEDGRNWHLPVLSVVGKLGEENGPGVERVREIAQLRDAYLKGASLSEPAALEPPAPSSEGAPAHDRYDGPGDSIDFEY